MTGAQPIQPVPPLAVDRERAPGPAAPAQPPGEPDAPRPSLVALGALGYGHAARGGPDDADGVEVPLLSGLPAMVDVWRTTGPVSAGRTGGVRWRHNGHWLWGATELHDPADGGGTLLVQAYRAYSDIFATLQATGCGHLQRLWNYLPGINADGGGLERYRQFNTGRQRAFLEAGSSVFEGAPAACAIGTQGGPMCVRFLAGRARPVPVENPRQVSAYRYPSAYGPTSPTFSRAALIDAGGGRVALLISGTASIVGHQTLHLGDVVAQTHETLRNLQAVIDAAHAKTSARFSLPSLVCALYVRHAQDVPRIVEVLNAELGAAAPMLRGAVHLQADICRHDLLVEIEAHAMADGALFA